MSTTKHRFYRRVLSIERSIWSQGPYNNIPVTKVVWCVVDKENSRSIYSSHVAISVYVGQKRHSGTEARVPRKPYRIQKYSLDTSAVLSAHDKKDAFNKACLSFINEKSKISPLIGSVIYFDRNRGEGMLRSDLGTYMIYACNLPGRRTWYAETACTYLDKGDIIKFYLSDGLVVAVEGPIKFDDEKWNRLDHDSLAFRVDESGELISRLFK